MCIRDRYSAPLTTVVKHPIGTVFTAYVVILGIATAYLFYQFNTILRIFRERSQGVEKDFEALKKNYVKLQKQNKSSQSEETTQPSVGV